MHRIFPRSFAMRVFAICFTGTHLPFLAYVFLANAPDLGTGVVLLGATLLGTGATLLAIHRMLQPLEAATQFLHDYATSRTMGSLPDTGPDMVGRLVSAIKVVCERSEEMIRSLAIAAETDSLTKLPNRRAFDAFAKVAFPFEQCAIAIVDVDHFKRVNDTLGHARGDEVLKMVADYLKGGIRATDFVARLGGEEFVIVFPNTDPLRAALIVDRIRSRLCEDAPVSVACHPVTFSAGVSVVASNDDSIEDAMARADDLLYAAKKAGRNRIEFLAA